MILKYRVLHVQTVDEQKQIEHEGEVATLTVKRVIVELLPEGHDGGVVRISAPADTTHYVEDTVIDVTFGEAE